MAAGHHWGRGVCEVVSLCDPDELDGAPCTGVNGERGYCFERTGGNEFESKMVCGRMLSLNNEYYQRPIALENPDHFYPGQTGPYRCPRHAEVTELGQVEVVRLLIGGCMDPTDTVYYDSMAEVHIPSMCGKTYGAGVSLKGCMFTDALNHDNSARTPGKCLYRVNGCTNSSAVNYNSEASDDDGSCIYTVRGCTIKNSETSYAGVASDTPNYQIKYYGSALRGVGKIDVNDAEYPNDSWNGYPMVTNYNPAANVLEGCIVAVEGCMDSTAVNYDPYATINTNSWCIPVREGCMMPTRDSAKFTYDNPSLHDRQGLASATSYDPLATVHVKSMCVVEYLGCLSTTALNYDSRATVDAGDCWEPKRGCLDDAAINYGCIAGGASRCSENLSGPGRLTIHEARLCSYVAPPPPSPPRPPADAGSSGTKYTSEIEYSLTSEPPANYTTTMKNKVAATANVNADDVDVIITAPSTRRARALQSTQVWRVLIIVTSSSSATAERVSGDLQSAAGDTWETSSTFLAVDPADLNQLPVYRTVSASQAHPPSTLKAMSTVTMSLTIEIYAPFAPPSPPSDDVNVGAVVGGVIGGLIVIILVAVIIWLVLKKRKAKQNVQPAY
eukprot:6032132-Pleurochrysis_carterae.AAC.1